MRQAVPLSFSPDGTRLLVGSTLTGTQQLYSLPLSGGELKQLTDNTEPVGGCYLPDGRVLVERDEGGNERTQLYVLGDGLEPLVVDPRFIHRTPRAAGSLLAYSTNRRNGVDFDIVARDLETGEERTFELGGNGAAGAVSADGHWMAGDRGGGRRGGNELFPGGAPTREGGDLPPHHPGAHSSPPGSL